MSRMMKKKKGFTLVELVVVIAILAILALILIPTISGYVNRANNSADEASARSIHNAVMLVIATDSTLLGTDGTATITPSQISAYVPSSVTEGDSLSDIAVSDNGNTVTFTFNDTPFVNGIRGSGGTD